MQVVKNTTHHHMNSVLLVGRGGVKHKISERISKGKEDRIKWKLRENISDIGGMRQKLISDVKTTSQSRLRETTLVYITEGQIYQQNRGATCRHTKAA